MREIEIMEKNREIKENGSFKEVSTEQQSSIEISRNAKGDVAWKVKVYQDDPDIITQKIETFIKIAKEKSEIAK